MIRQQFYVKVNLTAQDYAQSLVITTE